MIVGNYQIGYGQGLLLHTGFGSNKSGEAMYVMRTSNTGLKPHQAFYNYGFTGIGTTLFWKAWEQSFYYAYNEIDGKVEEEAGGNQYVKSIQRSDSHRTIAEINKKAQVNEQLIGVRGSPERDILSLQARLGQQQVYRTGSATEKTIGWPNLYKHPPLPAHLNQTD